MTKGLEALQEGVSAICGRPLTYLALTLLGPYSLRRYVFGDVSVRELDRR